MATQGDRRETRVVVVGAGGQGRIVADILLAGAGQSGLVPLGFVDDGVELKGRSVLGLPILGSLEQLAEVPHDAVVVAIGDNLTRQRLSLELEARGEHLTTVRHPFSSVGHDVTLGVGCMISAGVVLTPSTRVGRGVIVNTNSSIDHETVVGDFVHIGPGAVVGANVAIGARTLIGTAAAVMSGRTLGADVIVGAGALVHASFEDGTVAVGVPAQARDRSR